MMVGPGRAALLGLSAVLACAVLGRGAAAGDASQLAASCASCHALDGGGIPRIEGLDQGLIELAMSAYRSGRRESQVMRVVANALSPDEIASIASYLSAQGDGRR